MSTLGDRTYEEYLASAEWRQRREAALARAEHHCQICNSATDLQVHHRTYERIGAEREADLTVLCALCHMRFHLDLVAEVRYAYRNAGDRQEAFDAIRTLLGGAPPSPDRDAALRVAVELLDLPREQEAVA